MQHVRTFFDFANRETLIQLMRRAQELKGMRSTRTLPASLKGRAVGILFEKASTRTRLSFETGIALLGGIPLVMHSRDMQIARGEPLCDTARVLGGYLDALVVRTYGQNIVDDLANYAGIPVINGLTDLDHPCQILTDLFTVFERRENPFALSWTYIGDGSSNMANGFIAAAALTGMPLKVCTPVGYDPDPAYLARAQEAGNNVTVLRDPIEAVKGAQVVVTDVWVSMGQEAEAVKRIQDFVGYQLNESLLRHADDEYFVLHCLPAHRGEEITEDVLEGRHSLVFTEAANRLPVQQAILEWVLQGR